MSRALSLYAAVLMMLAMAGPAWAADCPDTALVRREAQNLLRKGESDRAIALLEKTSIDVQVAFAAKPPCEPTASDLVAGNAAERDFYRLQNDLALAYLRVGRDTQCSQALAVVIGNPKSRFAIEQSAFDDDAVAKALADTQARCGAHFKARMRKFRSPACPFEVKDGIAAIALPGTKGEEAACLALLRGGAEPGGGFPTADMERPPKEICPSIARVSRRDRQRLSVVPAPHQEGPAGNRAILDPLADNSNCCNIAKLAWLPGPGRGLVRVTGSGRDCFGGTAYTSVDTIYRWQGDRLQRSEDNSVGYH